MEENYAPLREGPEDRQAHSGKSIWNKRSGMRLLMYGLIGTALVTLSAVAAFAVYIARLAPQTPDVTYLNQVKIAQPSIMLSADGTELAIFKRNQQEWVPLSRISPHVINALIATEDQRFYDHHGIDIKRSLSALFFTVQGDTQGGSTITQQLARNLFPEEIGRSKSLTRKLKEMITAYKIEERYSKEQILETYLNTVPFLYNAFGIEMAARTYFNQSSSELGQLESATLVGMLKGTHYYNPVLNPERARSRRNVVLGQMLKQRMLAQETYLALREEPLLIRFNRQVDQSIPSTHFTEHVRKWLIDWADRNDYDLYADGLVVHTTLDDAIQESAMRAVQRQTEALQYIADVEWGRKSESVLSHSPDTYVRMRRQVEPFSYFWKSRQDLVDAFIRESPEFRKAAKAGANDVSIVETLKKDGKFLQRLRDQKTRLEAGFVAIDPGTGEIKAWVGSRDFRKDQFDHVAQAARQPGSTFKPIVYGAALEQGFEPSRAYRDTLVTIQAPDGDVWKPTDMTAPTGRSMSMREGLIHSKNTITARVMQDAGLSNIVSLAKAVGVNQSKLAQVPSLALGTSPVTLLEMVSAYVTIARSGEYVEPVFIKRITDRHGKVVAEFGAHPQRALSEHVAIELIDMMRGVVNRGTGQIIKSQFGINADMAGKTGTTQNNTDGWFIMMHPNLVAGTWVGFNDARVTMRSDYWGQGGHNALLVVGDFFKLALKEKFIDAKAKFPKPQRMPLMVERQGEDWATVLQERVQEHDGVAQEATGQVTYAGNTGSGSRPRRSPEEIARIMRSLGKDPSTSVTINMAGSSDGASGREGQTSSGSSGSQGTSASSNGF